MRLAFVISDPTLKASILKASDGSAWSPSAAAFVATPTDALLTPVWGQAAGLKTVGTLVLDAMPVPAKTGDYVLVWSSATGPVATWQITPPTGTSTMVVVTGTAVTIG